MCNKGIKQFYLPPTHETSVFTPQPQDVTALWLLHIAPSHERMARLTSPGWLVTYRDKCPTPGIEPVHSHPIYCTVSTVGCQCLTDVSLQLMYMFSVLCFSAV